MKVCVIVLAGLLATLILRKRSAAIRHWVLATTMVCAMAPCSSSLRTTLATVEAFCPIAT